ncbi:hypothetical protein BOX15_Mlig003763g3 [Macrostomum lignano]|uniref:C2 DOCK-type domain-containing protein n=1 Tax=Macrostomum lignano TaxID=282301 RepID=A0A267GHD7_9PLAT|nr:hypothetical protein BOX15_Mlig003763g3 [Macrostomum lignano]
MSSGQDDGSGCPGHDEGNCHLDDFFAQAFKSFEAEANATASGAASPQSPPGPAGGPAVDEEPAALLVRLVGLDCPNCPDPLELTLTLCTESATGCSIESEWEPLTLLCDPALDLQQQQQQQLDAPVLFREVGGSLAATSSMHIRMDRRGRLPSPRLSLGGALRGGGGGGGVNGGAGSGSFVLRPFGQGFADVGRAATAGEVLSVRIGLIGDTGDSGGSGGNTVGGSVSSRMSRAASVAFDSPQRPSAAGSVLGQLKLHARIVVGAAAIAAAANSALLASRPTSQRGLGRADRDEAYLWLQRGEFGIKDPNVEIKAQVVDSAGSPVPAALANLEAALSGRGGPRPGEQQFRSRVLHHQARPVWNQIVRLDLSRLLLNAEYQVALEAWHRSSMSQRGERRLGFARLPLVAVERGVACLSPAGSRIVVFHDSEDAAVAAVAATSPTSTDSRSNLSSLDDRASSGEAGDAVDGRARRPVSNRITVILDFCTGRRSTSWRLASLLLPLPHQRSPHRPAELRLDTEDQRDLLACFHRLLASLLPRLCAQESSVSDPAFASLVRLLALAAKQPQQEAARIAACVAETQMPVGLHRVLLRQLATEVHRDFRLATGSQAVMRDLYDSVRPILRLVAASASREGQQRSEVVQPEFEFLFRALREHPIRPDNELQCKFASMLVTDCLPLLVAAAEPRWLWQQLRRLLTDLRAGQNGRLPLGLLRFTHLVEIDEFWQWPDTRLQLAEAAADHAIEVLIAQKVKIEEQVRPGNLGMLESTIRPLNELLRRLGLLDAATVEPEVRLLASRRLLRPLLQVCALVAFDRPVANMRLPQKPQEPKYLRWILTSIVSLMELFNRSEGAWHAWLEAADGASADAAAAACASWSPVLGLEVWPSLPAARTDLVDEAAEMLQFLSGIFDQYGGRWGAWNGLLLLESAVTMETMRRLAALLPLESLPGLAGAALSSLFSFIQQPQAVASMGERRRHPRLAALPPDLRQPALETARSIWARLSAPTRADLAPSLVPRLLRCAAAARPNQLELLSEAVGMLADLLQIPDSAHASATQLTLALDKLMEEQRADEGFSARFRRQLAEALDEANGAPGSQLVSAVSEQLNLLRESARRPSGSAGSAAELADDPQALALHRLQRFYQEAGLHQLAWRCCLRLWQLQQRAGRLIEAACCLASVARSLDWSDEAPPGGDGFKLPVELRDCTTQAQLKERLLQTASERFRAGGLPLKAKQLTEELWLHLKDRLLEFKRERAVLLRLSGLCQELQSPNLSDWRCPAPAYYLAALRSGAEAELPAGLRRAAGATDAPRHFVCAFPDGASIEEAAARLERLLHGAIVLPAALAGAEDAFSEDLDESDGEDEEIFEDPDAADTQSCDSPALRIRLYPLTPVPEPPMPGLVGGGSGFGGFSALSAMRHHRYNDVRRFQRFDAPRRRRQRHRLLRLYETEEPLPAPVRLLPARLLETRRQGPLEVATASAEATVWQLRCAARQIAEAAPADPEEAAEDWRQVAELSRRSVAEVDAALAELRAAELVNDADEAADGGDAGAGSSGHRSRLLGEARQLFEQATRCLELLYHRRPPGIGTGGSNEEVVDISRQLLQRLCSFRDFRDVTVAGSAATASCRDRLELLESGSGPPIVSRNFCKRPSLL